MDAKQIFTTALKQATATIGSVERRHFKNATPCTDWDCRVLVNHMLYELSWVPDMLAGKTVAEVGSKYDGDLFSGDFHQAWHLAAHRAANAVKHTNPKAIVHLSYADVLAEHYIKEIAGDLLIHSWDAGQSLQCSLVMDADLAQSIYDNVNARKQEFAASGLFGQPFEAPESARTQTKLLALVGRHEPAV